VNNFNSGYGTAMWKKIATHNSNHSDLLFFITSHYLITLLAQQRIGFVLITLPAAYWLAICSAVHVLFLPKHIARIL